MKGAFITFEGSEGCGKSTQSRLLWRYLKQKGCDVVYLREPGGTRVSEKIRRILLDRKNEGMSAACETLLYMAARAELVSRLIEPALKGGKVVVCDRFLDSTLAYQGYGLGIDLPLIRAMGKFATAGVAPGLTIYLDIPVKDGLRHRGGSEDRIEKRSLAYHRRVAAGYRALARKEPGRIRVVKIQAEKKATQDIIRAAVDSFLARR